MIDVKFEEGINDLTTENLYQWDTYQILKISGIDFGGVTPKVHFANKKSTVALVVSGVFTDDGGVKVSIPNSLLTEKYDILAYVYTNTGLTCKTIKSITIPIISRLKPSEYTQPTDEDIAQIEAIELEAKVIIDGLTASEYSSTEKYKRPNIVYYELGSYMCKSNTEITGVLPTDTTKWQKLAQGIRITGISVNDDGYMVITCNDGASFNIGFRTTNVTTVNSTDFPALGITKDSNGVLKIGDTIIPQKVLLKDLRFEDFNNTKHTIKVDGLGWNDIIEIEYNFDGDLKEISYHKGSRGFYLQGVAGGVYLYMDTEGELEVGRMDENPNSILDCIYIGKIYKIIE